MRTHSPARFALRGRYPQRHQDRDPVSGELLRDRVEPFPRGFARDRYATARRNTSFSCSSSRIRFRASRTSTDSVLLRPGVTPSSTAASCNHFCNSLCEHRTHCVNTELFRDLLDHHSGFTVAGDKYDIVTELARVRLRHNNILPVRPPGPAKSRCHLSVQQTQPMDELLGYCSSE